MGKNHNTLGFDDFWVLHHLSSQNPPLYGIVTFTSISAELEFLGQFIVCKFFDTGFIVIR